MSDCARVTGKAPCFVSFLLDCIHGRHPRAAKCKEGGFSFFFGRVWTHQSSIQGLYSDEGREFTCMHSAGLNLYFVCCTTTTQDRQSRPRPNPLDPAAPILVFTKARKQQQLGGDCNVSSRGERQPIIDNPVALRIDMSADSMQRFPFARCLVRESRWSRPGCPNWVNQIRIWPIRAGRIKQQLLKR